ncbi:MAG: YidC/Oxa1 family membrane protein insertase [Oscillospiraceae bacterium]|nr:YidC/Oxa1 family membrane protein insertase [Oscillospiraceae bacterium]
MFDFILVPFALLLRALNGVVHNYGVAIILFAIIVYAILTPFAMKGKKGTLKTSQLTPKMNELKKKYEGDTARYNEELQKLYKEEDVKPLGGCLWGLLPLFLLIPIYSIVRMPFTELLGFTAGQFAFLRDSVFPAIGVIQDGAVNLTFGEVSYAALAGDHLAGLVAWLNGHGDAIRNAALTIPDSLAPMSALFSSVQTSMADSAVSLFDKLSRLSPEDLNFNFFGLNLAAIPSYKVWAWDSFSWANIGLFLLPLINVVLSMISTRISMASQGAAAEQMGNNKMMFYMMPLFSLVWGFTMPGLMGLYWIIGTLLQGSREYVLNKHYKKIIDAENAERDAKRAIVEAEREAKRLETERLRAESGLESDKNTSKKKLELKEKQDREAKRLEWEKTHEPEKSVKLQKIDAKPASQVDKRKFARGRNYDPNRYSRNVQLTDNGNNAGGEALTAPPEDKEN